MRYYEVAPLKIIRAESPVFTYASEQTISPGSLVTIPVGRQLLSGLVMREVPRPSYETKTIENIFDTPPLPQALLTTAEWMSEYYATHLATVLQTVLPRGVTKQRRARPQIPYLSAQRDRTNFVLNFDQRRAVQTIHDASDGTIILHGVTGSGKTAVYINVAKSVIATGKSVIVLVPEISLTSQLIAEFEQHFDTVLLTHSRQTEAERHLTWLQALHADKPFVAIGPRSALFLPFSSLGAIIIDEAHEPSFKQDQAPRYSALRVASILAREHHAKVIQGSATPLVNEYYLAEHAKRPIIAMEQRARRTATASEIILVDMKQKQSFHHHRFISDDLFTALTKALENHQQSLIFHNRRGSASTTLCENCGWSAICPRCFVPFTLHADRHQLRCHICNNVAPVPTSCPVCHSTNIIHKGIGTKLIESELRRLFPKARIARFDGDATNAESLEQHYQALYDGDVDIIIGTQVVAKGLDLPHLQTVGVIQADAGLNLPDYAAAERTFQLLAQVVGRVGRDEKASTAIIQSYRPDSPIVQYGISQDYTHFYHHMIEERKRAYFPPFSYLLRLTCIYKTEAIAIRHAQEMAVKLRRAYPDVTVFGPTPAFYERQRDTYRWQLVLKSSRRSRLLEIIKHVPTAHWQFDIDPASLL